MTHARSQPSRTLLNREYPHQVLVPSWNVRGKLFEKVDAFHVQIGAPMKKRSIFKNDSRYELYCFAQRQDAESFQELFGGHLTRVKAED
jgi:hypothetical protein